MYSLSGPFVSLDENEYILDSSIFVAEPQIHLSNIGRKQRVLLRPVLDRVQESATDVRHRKPIRSGSSDQWFLTFARNRKYSDQPSTKPVRKNPESRPGVNIIKLFTSVIYECFVIS